MVYIDSWDACRRRRRVCHKSVGHLAFISSSLIMAVGAGGGGGEGGRAGQANELPAAILSERVRCKFVNFRRLRQIAKRASSCAPAPAVLISRRLPLAAAAAASAAAAAANGRPTNHAQQPQTPAAAAAAVTAAATCGAQLQHIIDRRRLRCRCRCSCAGQSCHPQLRAL